MKYHVELCPPDIDPPMAAWVMRGPDAICMCWMGYDAEMIVKALNCATEIAELSAKSKTNTDKWHKANSAEEEV